MSAGCVEMRKLHIIGLFSHFGGPNDSPDTYIVICRHNKPYWPTLVLYYKIFQIIASFVVK